MPVRLIALDLDDTLLKTDLTISETNRLAVRRAEEEGIAVVIASGRNRRALDRYVAELGMDLHPGYVICDNGALVAATDTDEILVRHVFSERDAREAFAVVRELGLPAELYRDGAIHASFDNPYSHTDARLSSLALIVEENFEALLSDPVPKFVIPGDPARLKAALPIIRSRLGEKVNVFISKPYFLEILPAAADKGTGLKILSEKLGIPREDILVIGDAMNDAGMVSYAGYGIAMRNGVPELKALARWITRKTNEENGVAETIERFALRGTVQTFFCPPEPLERAAAEIAAGRLVVFPTETVYGLGANALDAVACAGIFRAKGRPQDNPLIVHVSTIEGARRCAASLSPAAEALFKAYSPGPLTLVVKKSAAIPDTVTAGQDTVGIRIPSHPVARRLLELTGLPIAAPSANVSGEPSPTTFRMASLAMDALVNAIVDGGDCSVGLESTIVDATGDTLRILRPGGVSRDMIEAVLPPGYTLSPAEAPTGGSGRPMAPGMKYTHYKPRATVYLAETIDLRALEDKFDGQEIGILVLESDDEADGNGLALRPAWHLQRFFDAESYAQNLFKCFALFDGLGCSAIIAEYPPSSGIGEALRNRLYKSAGGVFL
jgi:L-threonylcarbamoyladenylate synthase